MGNLSDRLKQFEETSTSELEAFAKAHQSVLDALRQKLLGLQSGALSSIEADIQSFHESVRQSAERSRNALKAELERSASEAQDWSRRGLKLWTWSGGVLIAWLLLLIGASGWTLYLYREIPKLESQYDELKAAYPKESFTLDLVRKHRVVVIARNDGSLWFQIDSKSKPEVGRDGKTLWLLAEPASGK